LTRWYEFATIKEEMGAPIKMHASSALPMRESRPKRRGTPMSMWTTKMRAFLTAILQKRSENIVRRSDGRKREWEDALRLGNVDVKERLDDQAFGKGCGHAWEEGGAKGDGLHRGRTRSVRL
jgi:hypothetical protein